MVGDAREIMAPDMLKTIGPDLIAGGYRSGGEPWSSATVEEYAWIGESDPATSVKMYVYIGIGSVD